jgi:hypothetical protein
VPPTWHVTSSFRPNLGGLRIRQPRVPLERDRASYAGAPRATKPPGTTFTAREVSMWRGLFVTLVVCAACGAAAAALVTRSAALPSRQTLEVTAPTARAPQRSLRARPPRSVRPASLYVLTRQMTAQVNGVVGGALDTLGDITRTPAGRGERRLRGVGSVQRAALAGGRAAPGHPRGSGVPPLRARAATRGPGRTRTSSRSSRARRPAPRRGPEQGHASRWISISPTASTRSRTPGRVTLVAGWTVVPDGRQVQVAPRRGARRIGPEHHGRDRLALLADGSGTLVFDAEATWRRPEALEAGKVAPAGSPSARGRRMWS